MPVVKLTTGMEWEWERLELLFYHFYPFANSLEPGETPSNSASHQAPDYLPIGIVMYVAVDIRSI